MSKKIIFRLGGFSFSSSISLDNFEVSLDMGVSFTDRIRNHPIAIFGKRWSETITLSGETLPLSGAGNNSLVTLIDAAKSQKKMLLTTSSGKCLGTYIVTSVKETRKNFLYGGIFLSQSFSLSLQRVSYD